MPLAVFFKKTVEIFGFFGILVLVIFFQWEYNKEKQKSGDEGYEKKTRSQLEKSNPHSS